MALVDWGLACELDYETRAIAARLVLLLATRDKGVITKSLREVDANATSGVTFVEHTVSEHPDFAAAFFFQIFDTSCYGSGIEEAVYRRIWYIYQVRP